MNQFGRFLPIEGLILGFSLMFTIVPIILAIWFLLKIHSIDTTLKEISRKLDRLKNSE